MIAALKAKTQSMIIKKKHAACFQIEQSFAERKLIWEFIKM